MTKAMRKPLLRLLRLTGIYALTIAAAVQLCFAGGLSLILVPVVWGVGVGISMENGIRSAPASHFKQPVTRTRNLLGYFLLLAMFFLPAFVAIYLGGWLTGLSIAPLTLVSISWTSLLGKRVFGSWKHESPQNSGDA